MSDRDYMDQLRAWWHRHCDGEWEHEFGISIETMDDPGWLVKIDLMYTSLEVLPLGPFVQWRDARGWIECLIAPGTASGSTEEGYKHFVGMGGPSNLKDIIECFLAASEGKPSA